MTPRTLLLCALTILGACSDPTGPNRDPDPDPDPASDPPDLPRSAALVSSAIVRTTTASGAAIVLGQAYVSMVPGTDPAGRQVEIRNLRNRASATGPMRNGGFDPVAVPADAGDTLSITVFHQAGDETTGYSVVPMKSRPRVVRTSPGMGKTDVALNSVIVVVFNQPIDSASLTDALGLRQDGADVPGSVIGESTGGVILSGRFVPDRPLAPQSTYQLSVSAAARSPDGTPLDAPLTIEFTTTASAGVARLRVVHAEPHVSEMDVLVDGTEVVSGLSYLAATDYLEVSSGSHEVWYQVGGMGTMDATYGSFAAGAEYTVLPCCVRFPSGGHLFRDDNSEPTVGNARVRIIDYASVSSGVKVYLTAPGVDLTAATPTATINITDATEYIEVPAGDYQIRITAWDSDIIAMDSGTLTFSAGQVRTLVATDAPGGGEPGDFLILEDRN